MNTPNDNILQKIAILIVNTQKSTPLLVCVDGVDGVGKSHFAQKLAREIEVVNKNAVLCSVDDFHNPADIRYQKGIDSAQRNTNRSKDKKHIGSEQAIIEKYNRRYMQGQKLYLLKPNRMKKLIS